ncbi:MAG: MBOAT family protein [Clostridiales bacterium]|nr:MBOAT family protein [Clostridiales bacterium]
MSIFSFAFILFLIISAAVYFIVPGRVKWVCLLAASIFFYVCAGVQFLPFLLFTMLTTFITGLLLDKQNQKQALALSKGDSPLSAAEKKQIKKRFTTRKRLVLSVGLILNFAVLFVVKYANFVLANINQLLASFGETHEVGFLQIVLPLGLSFYIFQSAGYMIDVYRGKVAADKNFFKYSLFVSYFPQIIQGPIGRHSELAGQLFEPHTFDYTRVKFGAQRMLWGFIKKMVIADRIAVVVNQIFDHYAVEGYVGITVFVGALLYGVQIYADFAGGMDIVLGVSQIFGVELTENFRRPFMAKSVAEFWQRWHITLGAWMRDYLFYPLALSKPFNKMGKGLRRLGSRYVAKVLPTCLASFIVFVLIGLWHGASWKYVVYGLYQAVFVSTATLFEPLYAKGRALLRIDQTRFSYRCFQTMRTIFIVTIGRYLSRAVSLTSAIDMLKATLSKWNPWVLFDDSFYTLGLEAKEFRLMLVFIVLLFAVDILQEKGVKLRESLAKQGVFFRWFVYLAALFMLIVFGMYGEGITSANFIYQGF